MAPFWNEKYSKQGQTPIIVFDRATYHWSEITKYNLEWLDLWALSLPSYSPDLNPAEIVIMFIKQKLKRELIHGG